MHGISHHPGFHPRDQPTSCKQAFTSHLVRLRSSIRGSDTELCGQTRVTLGSGVPDISVEGVSIPMLDDQAAVVVAARELAHKPYYRCKSKTLPSQP